MEWYETLFLVLLFGGGPVIFLLVLPYWHIKAVRAGLYQRKRGPVSVKIDRDRIVVTSNERVYEMPVSSIALAVLAVNANWTESSSLEDALNLKSSSGLKLKIPASTEGFGEVTKLLSVSGVAVIRKEVEAPAYLD